MGIPAYRFDRVAVPGGSFRMGCAHANEGPVRKVTVSPFQMAATTVSVGQFEAHCALQQSLPWGRLLYSARGHVVGALRYATKEATAAAVMQLAAREVRWCVVSDLVQLVPTPDEYVARFTGISSAETRFLRDELPATMVQWVEAALFALCAEGRLPTEAEYELAARLDASDTVREVDDVAGTGSGAVTANEVHYGQAWQTGGPLPVAAGKSPHRGAHHLAGNVYTYMADQWAEAFDPADVVDPLHFEHLAQWHVVRGGAWNLNPEYARAAARDYGDGGGSNNVGVRVVWPQDSLS